MSYFDEEIIKDFNRSNTQLFVLSEIDQDVIVDKVNSNLPFSGSRIEWSSLKNSVHLGTAISQTALISLAEKIKLATKESVIIVGDSTDNSYSVSVENLLLALQIFSTIPQHTYILQQHLNWIAFISFEEDIYFSNL
ncbi:MULTISPECIES: hypothetical protein [Pseudomonas]|uniref:hypothetical protein n=1 Tax=Pseudomonas TaxID=286 RepID=UPI0009BC9C52|nr:MULTISPECIES: hypothetical protein [Pseudomonas]